MVLKSGWHHGVVEVGGNITSFLVVCGLLPNCLLAAVCLFIEMAGKDERERYESGSKEKAGEGESKQEGWVQVAGREPKGQIQSGGARSKSVIGGPKERGTPSLVLLQGEGLSLARGAGCRHPPAAASLHWFSSWAALPGVAFTAAAAHEYAICCYICSRPVIPLQPCGYAAFHFAEKACQNSFKNEVKAFLIQSFFSFF